MAGRPCVHSSVLLGARREALTSLEAPNNGSLHLSFLGSSVAAGGKEMDSVSLTNFSSASLVSWEVKSSKRGG